MNQVNNQEYYIQIDEDRRIWLDLPQNLRVESVKSTDSQKKSVDYRQSVQPSDPEWERVAQKIDVSDEEPTPEELKRKWTELCGQKRLLRKAVTNQLAAMDENDLALLCRNLLDNSDLKKFQKIICKNVSEDCAKCARSLIEKYEETPRDLYLMMAEIESDDNDIAQAILEDYQGRAEKKRNRYSSSQDSAATKYPYSRKGK